MNRNLLGFGMRHGTIRKKNTEFRGGVLDDWQRRAMAYERRRHLAFATEKQMRLLSRTENWFLDGTFQIIRAPFTQLYSIHTFIQHGDSMKQASLLFVFMSGKRMLDYEALFHCLVVKISYLDWGQCE